MYHPPGDMIYATVGLVYINLQPEYELLSSIRFEQYRKFGKNWSWGHRPPQPPLKNFLHGVRVFVRDYLRVRFDLPSFIKFRYISGFPKLGPITFIRGHPIVVPLDSTDMISY